MSLPKSISLPRAVMSAVESGGVEVGVRRVALGHDRGLAGPDDAEARVVPANAARGFGPIKIAHLVEDVRVVLERDESVGKAGRHEECSPFLGRELDAE